jgi:hypothetical protein
MNKIANIINNTSKHSHHFKIEIMQIRSIQTNFHQSMISHSSFTIRRNVNININININVKANRNSMFTMLAFQCDVDDAFRFVDPGFISTNNTTQHNKTQHNTNQIKSNHNVTFTHNVRLES